MTAQTDSKATCPRFIVCEDGREYLDRFERFLAADFEFVPAGDYATLLTQLRQNRNIAGILLDLDFRRTAPSQLVNEHGQPVGQQSQESLATHVANQGLFILASLREQGLQHQVLLFADLDDTQQREYLMRTFAPLELVPSHLGMLELKNRLIDLGSASKSRS